MPLVEVADITLADCDAHGVRTFLDFPRKEMRAEAHALDVVGWVLRPDRRVSNVEFVVCNKVIQQTPINHRRPDIREAFPDIDHADESGFRARLDVRGRTPNVDLQIRARFRGDDVVHLAVVRMRRRWREHRYAAGSALVSVVIPCFNQGHFLADAIESVLAQSYRHFEIVVVDDGSTDNTGELARRYPGVRCVRQENGGLSAARNTGVRRSSGDFLVFLDADNRLLPEALAIGLESLEEHPECGFVSGRFNFIASDGSFLWPSAQKEVAGDPYAALLRENYIGMPATVMYRRSVFEVAKGFDSRIDPAADYDLSLRVATSYPVHFHGRPVAECRQHGGNMTGDPARMLEAVMTAHRAHRSVVRGDEVLQRAYREGVRFWRQYYGDPLARELRSSLRAGQWAGARRKIAILARYDPRALIRAHAA